jgi:hypothetical protein
MCYNRFAAWCGAKDITMTVDIFQTTFASDNEHEKFLANLAPSETSLRCVGNALVLLYPDVRLNVACGIELTANHPRLNSGSPCAKEMANLAKRFDATFDGWDEDGFALFLSPLRDK